MWAEPLDASAGLAAYSIGGGGVAGVNWVADRGGCAGGALALSGGSWLTSLATLPALPQGNAPRAAAAWVSCTLPNADTTFFEWGGGGGVFSQRSAMFFWGSWCPCLAFIGDYNDLPSSMNPCSGTWAHVAYSYNGTIMTLFVNGARVGFGALSNGAPLATPLSQVFVGWNGNPRHQNGEVYGSGASPQLIDDLRGCGAA